RERNARLRPDLPQLPRHLVLELRDLLDPERAEFLHPVAELDGGERGGFSVHLDDDVEVGPHGLADLREVLDALANRLAVIGRIAGRVETSLHAGPSLLFLLPPEVDLLLRRPRAALLPVTDALEVALVAVETNLVACLAPEELPDRLSERLPEDVPQRDLDGAQRGHQHRSAAIARADEHAAPEALDLRRIATDEITLVLLDGGGDGRALVRERPLTEAGDALVGVELDEDEILVVAGVDQEGLEVRDPEVQRARVLERPLERSGRGGRRSPGDCPPPGRAEARRQESSSVHPRLPRPWTAG